MPDLDAGHHAPGASVVGQSEPPDPLEAEHLDHSCALQGECVLSPPIGAGLDTLRRTIRSDRQNLAICV